MTAFIKQSSRNKTEKNIEIYIETAHKILLNIISEYKSYILRHGKVNYNVGPANLADSKPFTSQLLQTTNPLIARPLSESSSCAKQ